MPRETERHLRYPGSGETLDFSVALCLGSFRLLPVERHRKNTLREGRQGKARDI